jgi:hypothetical protein
MRISGWLEGEFTTTEIVGLLCIIFDLGYTTVASLVSGASTDTDLLMEAVFEGHWIDPCSNFA